MAGEPILKRGHANPHEWVVYAQQLFNHALAGGMHLDVAENGVFDQAFEQEVTAFQSRHGLSQDGVIGPNTWAALHRAVEAKQHAASAAAAEEEDPLHSAPRNVHSAVGHRDDESFHQRTDAHGDTVRVYDVDAEIIGSHAWEQAVASITMQAVKNTEMQIPYVLVAVQEFQASSRAQIDQFTQGAQQFLENSHVHFPWGLLVDGLDFGLSTVFEIPAATTVVGQWGEWILGKVKGALIGQLKAELEAHANPVPNLEQRLEAGVAALTLHVTQQSAQAVSDVAGVIPDYIREAMAEDEKQQVFENYEWIKAMVEYFGFPDRTMENVTGPILRHLNEQFGAMIHQVEEELVASG